MSATATTTPTQYVEVRGRRLAYRDFGSGMPILLCVRFRGTMDSWDPAFLDGLANNGFRVITFDYSGLGASTGARTYDPASLAIDATDLLDALNIEKAVVGGWSIGGVAAQILLATVPQRVSHLVLIGTTPPGYLPKDGDPLFYELAKRENDFEDIVALFFEPKSTASRMAAKLSQQRIAARTTDVSPAVPFDWAGTQLGDGPRNPMFPADAVLQALKSTQIPITHIGGDHDIIFPTENWHAMVGRLPSLRVLTFPQTGHGPHHQYPQESADHIASFVNNTK
ncbi:pimeloyl-ACP methyl ester carboxylesterase [Ochrobactrum daejeonense]|uniref:Pimeloyl-ACP methyl ester carboxylesterase n=1 Tax=Brucella daejeonensis TaxID=659015 RepID=A0A7W9AZW0_9HYPH|nr:alpha/beta hydrolase [Brucella daejeonensis]MBB5703683.1 pimeloyl-ACP methyl ester carboxylesterase [Brucella daejeonensis]NKB79896.1 alpha/beta hydrolase [Brucella daejeonensis]